MGQYLSRWRSNLAGLRAWIAGSSKPHGPLPSPAGTAAPGLTNDSVEDELALARKRIGLLEQQITRLKFDLSQARNQVSLLDEQRTWLLFELADARGQIASLEAQRDRPPDGLSQMFRKVGLDPSCPDFLIGAARTAFRKALHPDKQPERQRAEAERRFVEADAIFSELCWHRGLGDRPSVSDG